MPNEVSNRLITQSHGLARLPTKMENPKDLCPGTNDHEGLATHENKEEIKHITSNVYIQVLNYTTTDIRHRSTTYSLKHSVIYKYMYTIFRNTNTTRGNTNLQIFPKYNSTR